MNANITDIKRFAVHDGAGIRTTVFFKGCPLKCVWCHNPENISGKKQLAFYQHKCVLCGKCANVCKNHKIIKGKHILDRSECIQCNTCADVCPSEALIIYGKEKSCEAICDSLLRDKNFYEISGGGITLSGGECLMQPDACREILNTMKKNGINTAVDTCGMVPWENIEKIIDFTDIFLYDIKAMNEEVHKNCTGVSNKLILENLKRIDCYGKKIEIRFPYVPGYNDKETENIASFAKNIKNLVGVRVLPYHNYAASKYDALNMKITLPAVLPANEEIRQARDIFANNGIECHE